MIPGLPALPCRFILPEFHIPMTTQIKQYTIILLALWLCAGIFSLTWNIYDDSRQRKDLALQAAHAFLRQLENTSAWFSAHSGVYVPVTKTHQPNPLPTDDPEQNLRTEQGVQLTRSSAATMIRELSEIAASDNNATFHITSLTPIRPENRPYAWEKPWLRQFKADPREVSSVVTIEDKTLFRFMAPLIVQKKCLGCHVERQYSVGDIRGGISITLPMKKPGMNLPLLLAHFGPMAAGTLLILFFSAKLSAAKSELQTSRDRLEQQVSIRTLELTEVNQRLNRKIHKQAHIEKALTMIYDEFYQLFNSAPDGMLVIDQNFDILRANLAFTRLCGVTINKIIGQKCYDMFSGPNCRTSSCPLRAIFKGEKRFEIECEEIIISPTRTIPCIVTSTPFREADGSLIGAIMVITDISSRRQAELALEESTARLRESNRALEDFAHIISHDLQEPLMLIQAFSRRLQDKTGEKLNQQSRQYVEQIDTAAGRMRELINGLLLYAKVNNKTEPFVPVDLSAIVDEVLDTLTLHIEESNSTIIKDRLPMVSGAPLQIRQLFQNILSNSLKYRNKHVQHVIHIEYRGRTKDNDCTLERITIRDNGIGFDNNAGQHIFDIFERLQTGRDIDGTGIGLAICKKIITCHGGSIVAAGQQNQGASFTFSLPSVNRQPLKNK